MNMRFLSFSVVITAASGALILACSSSNADAPPSVIGPTVDGGPGGTDVDGSTPVDGGDAAAIDDSGEPDLETTPGPVTVTVSSGQEGPIEGATVIIRDTDGSEETIATDSNGDATRQLVHAGATVTVATTSGARRSLATIAKIEPSEKIFVGTPLQSYVSVPYTVDVEAFAGASSYVLDWGCGIRLFPSAGEQKTGYVTSKCLDSGGALRVLVTARNASSVPIAYAFKTVTPGGGNASVSISAGDWSAAGASASLTASNVPGAAAYTLGEIAFANGEAWFGVEDMSLPLAFVRPSTGFTPSLLRGAEVSFGYSLSGRFELQPIGTGDVSEDASVYLPPISAPLVSGTTSAPSLAWTAAGNMASLTGGFIAELESSKTEGNEVVPIRWTLVFPGQSGTSFAPPALPAALADYVPTDPWVVTKITVIDSAQFGYRQLHRDPVGYQAAVRNRDLAKLGTTPFAVRYAQAVPLPPP